ncbi:DUF7286 family protein [Haladaptatus caseinilyticus]|uniref:DUF7286 family protein n=1 Tax=Haladaptatus caseinilyticus TaxID=2993314 RepID=UPI00224B47AE|nr:hypothetical protein [Haladaptatus caseinilyticus]
MRLADDTRGRVPFALVGVLLLVGSATFAGTLGSRESPTVDRSVERAMDRLTASTQTTLRSAVQRASRDAAAQPVIRPANTTEGNVVNGSEPFRAYLRLRIYLSARNELRATSAHVGDVRASASLAPTPNASALRQAVRRVHIAPVGTATESGLRVRIENVSIQAYRGESVVARASRNMTLVVETPVLALHERVQEFERRLDRDPFKPGLGRRLTARLYATTWARGYAQYGGAPIENVLANRHVELMTNGALLEEQRNAFGRSDPAGRHGLRRATAQVGVADVLIPTTKHGTLWADTVLETTGGLRDEPTTISDPSNMTRTPNDGMIVGVNESAEKALLDIIENDEQSAFDAAVDSGYRVTVRPVASVRNVRDESRPRSRSPGKNWTLVEQRTETRVVVEKAEGNEPETIEGWHLLWSDARRVQRTHVAIRQWKRDNRTKRTTGQWTDEFIVSLGVAGDHTTTETAPTRPLPTAHRPGGRFSGANLADIERKAVSRLISDGGGPERLARRAVDRTLDTRPKTEQGRVPKGLRSWVYSDVRGLCNEIRNLSVTVSRGAVGSGKTNPAAALARTVRAHRGELVNAPSTYDSAAERARYAVRTAYVKRVLDRLDVRAELTRRTQQGYSSAIRDVTGVPLDRVRKVLEARKRVERPTRNPLPTAGPGAPTNLSVDGDPAYLTLSAVGHDHVSTVPRGERVHPMSARNINVFAVPSSDVADGIVSLLPDARKEKRVSLRNGALTLRAANTTLSAIENETLRRQRDEVQISVRKSIEDVERTLIDSLEPTGTTRQERRIAVRRGLARWDTTAGRALALSNGSAARPIALEIEELRNGPSEQWTRMQRDELALQVQSGLERARSETGGVKGSIVDPATKTVRRIVEYETKRLTKQAIEKGVEVAQRKWVSETMSSLAAGLPVAPVPGYWYATVNVWQVDVSGTYAQFTVRARQGSPVSPGASVAYVRRTRPVRMDVDDDGATELLGRTTPISFDTWTTVVIAVPPGKAGVGDVNGDADERSPGWSNRSNNPFDLRTLRDDHALRRDRQSR